MDERTILKLDQMNQDFYSTFRSSFSSTRKNPWNGWKRLLPYVEEITARTDVLRVLDAGCGNLRFERFLLDSLKTSQFEFTCVDSSKEMMDASDVESIATEERKTLHIRESNIVESLINANEALDVFSDKGAFDLVCAFGLMHHIPSFELRAKLIASLLFSCKHEGLVALAFWQFRDDERLAAKANLITSKMLDEIEFAGELEPGDGFLGWQDNMEVLRYCHHSTDDEIKEMISLAKELSGKDTEIAGWFKEDGKRTHLNRYAILKVKERS